MRPDRSAIRQLIDSHLTQLPPAVADADSTAELVLSAISSEAPSQTVKRMKRHRLASDTDPIRWQHT